MAGLLCLMYLVLTTFQGLARTIAPTAVKYSLTRAPLSFPEDEFRVAGTLGPRAASTRPLRTVFRLRGHGSKRQLAAITTLDVSLLTVTSSTSAGEAVVMDMGGDQVLESAGESHVMSVMSTMTVGYRRLIGWLWSPGPLATVLARVHSMSTASEPPPSAPMGTQRPATPGGSPLSLYPRRG